MRAIVLSGGGARGAYQIGVWKALRELKIRYDIVTGTSVGAINGALMVQNSYFIANLCWHKLSFNMIFDSYYHANTTNVDIYKEYAKALLKSGGMSVKNLEKRLVRIIKPRKIKSSRVDYGLVTVKLPIYKPVYLTKKIMDENKIIDYIIASSTCFPIFKQKDIEGAKYIDGGYYDNLPINLAIDMGADEVIAVDLDAIGFKHKVKDEKVKITYIKPRNDLDSTFIFNKSKAQRLINLGYNDMMKVYNRLDGHKYTFYPTELKRNWLKIRSNFLNIIKNYENDLNNNRFNLENIILKSKYKYIMDESDKCINNCLDIMEFLAQLFNIADDKIYRSRKFNAQLSNKLHTLDHQDFKYSNILMNNYELVLYLYHTLPSGIDAAKLRKIITIRLKEFLAAIYLLNIDYK